MTNKYAEGYPGNRYYGGCEIVDKTEQIAIDRLKQLFDAEYANVQPHSGAQANMAVFMTVLKPGDTFMGLNLAHGGHLSHGSPVNSSGILYRPVAYGVKEETGLVDYDMMEEIASKGTITRPSDGKPAKSVVFIQCAGQRDENYLPIVQQSVALIIPFATSSEVPQPPLSNTFSAIILTCASPAIPMPLLETPAMMPAQLLPAWLNTLRHFNPVDYAVVVAVARHVGFH
jgi:hypothetical protein